ncbi:MAG: hypothetical protein C4278_01585 [Patescibacteria group bacterium]
MKEIKVFTDGGAINNPGKAAIACVIYFDEKIKEYKMEIGEATNNEAEYQAVIFALKKIKQIIGKENLKNYKVIIHLDSELVGNQLLGKYKIEEERLKLLFVDFWNLKIDFGELEIKIIPREENKKADELVKSVLFKKFLV